MVRRTSALITFGSSVGQDGIFYFVQQVSGPQFLREALAAQRQPLILHYTDFRPKDFHWTNIYSHMDIVSGCLKYYDTPDGSKPNNDAEKNPNRVDNVIDWAAWVPVLAHVMYWKDQKLRDELYGAIG